MMRFKHKIEFNKSFVSGVIGVAVLVGILYFFHINTPKIGSVNIHRLINEHIEQHQTSTLSEKELSIISRQFIEKLERKVADLAREQRLYLIISDAVVSGVPDYTDLMRQRLWGKPE